MSNSSQKKVGDADIALKNVNEAFSNFNAEFPPVEFQDRPVCVPGIGDIFIRHVTRLGYKGEYPRPYDWENLLPQLRMDEELLWIVRKHGSEFSKNIESCAGEVKCYAFDVYLGFKYVGTDPLTSAEWTSRTKRFTALTRLFARGAFPESSLVKDIDEDRAVEFLRDIVTMRETRIVTGMPSIKDAELKSVAAKRDDRIRPYAGLNDIVEMYGDPGDDFAVVFSVSKAPAAAIKNSFAELFAIKNKIKPLVEQATQFSEGGSKQVSVNDSTTTTVGFVNVIPGGRKQTKKQRGMFPRMGRGIMNVMRLIGGTSGDEEKEFENQKLVVQEHAQETGSETIAKGRSEANTDSWNKTWTVKEVNSALDFSCSLIDETLEQLTQTLGTGGFLCGAVIYSNKAFLSESIAHSARAAMSGGQSALRPMRVYDFGLHEDDGRVVNKDWLLRKKSLARVLEEEAIPCGIMNCDKACLYLPIPTTHLVGLPLKRNVFYGKDTPEQFKTSGVSVGAMSFAEAHIQQETVVQDENHLELTIPEKDFYSHFFIVGTTGCGKTTRTARIIHDAQRFRRIILETAKKTYWKELGVPVDKVLVYTLGDSTKNPLRFNPFYFEPGTNLKQHIAILADAICDLLPMDALVGPKLREAVERSYQVCGWDIETSEFTNVGCAVKYPDVALFNLMVYQVAERMSDYGPEVRGNYRGALLNRAAIFMDAIYQDIFSFDGNKPIDEIFPKDKIVIIEMEEMPPSDLNMPAFIVSLLLQRVRARQNHTANTGTIKDEPGFLIVIEEAHNVLSKSIQDSGDSSQAGNGSHLVKQVTRMLAEGRGLKLGLAIVDQSAATIAPSVITNANTKMVFRQEDGTEIETIGKAIGLRQEEWNDLQLLEQGEYLLRNGKYPQPVKMAPLQTVVANTITRADLFEKQRGTTPPSYQKAERMVMDYCLYTRGGGFVKENGEWAFLGFDTEGFKKIKKRLCVLLNGNEDLVRYCIAKVAIMNKRYLSAHALYGIAYEGGEQ